MSPDSHLDAINRRLAEIAELLSHSAQEPSPEHFALLTERDRLRAEAAQYRSRKDEGRSTAELQAELTELRRRRSVAVKDRTGYITAKGGNSSGPAPGVWVDLALKSRGAGDIDRLTSRIAEIEHELANRTSSES